MWSLFKSIMNYLYGLIFRVVSIKFLIFTAIYWLLTKLFDIVKAIIGTFVDLSGLANLITALPAGMLFYLKVFRIDVGLPMVVAALIIKFTIRRVPIIG